MTWALLNGTTITAILFALSYFDRMSLCFRITCGHFCLLLYYAYQLSLKIFEIK